MFARLCIFLFALVDVPLYACYRIQAQMGETQAIYRSAFSFAQCSSKRYGLLVDYAQHKFKKTEANTINTIGTGIHGSIYEYWILSADFSSIIRTNGHDFNYADFTFELTTHVWQYWLEGFKINLRLGLGVGKAFYFSSKTKDPYEMILTTVSAYFI